MSEQKQMSIGVKTILEEAVVVVPFELTLGGKTVRKELRKPLLEFWDELKRSVEEKKGTEGDADPT